MKIENVLHRFSCISFLSNPPWSLLPHGKSMLQAIKRVQVIKLLSYQAIKFITGQDRSSPPEVYCKRVVLKNFPKFTRKHLCQSLFFDKVAGLRPETLSKKRLWHMRFLVNFANFLRVPFL